MVKEKIDDIISELQTCKGTVGFYYFDPETAEEHGYNADKAFLSASVIKLPVYAALMKKASTGEVDMDKLISVRPGDILPSCGAINLFSKPPVLDLKTICSFMIALSDNTASNLAIDVLGIDALNSEFKKMGFEGTHIERRLFDDQEAKKGRENYFVPQEIGRLLVDLYMGVFVDAGTSNEMIRVLKMQNINHKIPGLMEERFEVAHKTGEDDGISHDAGIVYCENPFIVVFASNNTDTGIFDDIVRRASLELTG